MSQKIQHGVCTKCGMATGVYRYICENLQGRWTSFFCTDCVEYDLGKQALSSKAERDAGKLEKYNFG